MLQLSWFYGGPQRTTEKYNALAIITIIFNIINDYRKKIGLKMFF